VTLSQALDGSLGVLLFRVGAMQAAATGALGLILAVSGIYGVVSDSGVQRAREIGIGLAPGAARDRQARDRRWGEACGGRCQSSPGRCRAGHARAVAILRPRRRERRVNVRNRDRTAGRIALSAW
jgi:hypothetical protein